MNAPIVTSRDGAFITSASSASPAIGRPCRRAPPRGQSGAAQATWAIAARCAPTTNAEVDHLYSNGTILRTRVAHDVALRRPADRLAVR
jgi:hypothetical protein